MGKNRTDHPLTPAAGGFLEVVEFKNQSYAETRTLQERLVRERVERNTADSLLFGEHPPTITLGKRASAADAGLSASAWAERGVKIIEVDRGGAATYHGPGQLMLYPVIGLQDRRIGVRTFVSRMLSVVARTASAAGLPAETDLCDTGVWLTRGTSRKKIASAGLRIVRGVTNHGFAVNVDCELENFTYFRPCGFSGTVMTSVRAELGENFDRGLFVGTLLAAIIEELELMPARLDAAAGVVGTQTYNSFVRQ